MKIGLRGGHSVNCIGAVGLLNEYVECQKVYARVAELLTSVGNTVVNCNTNKSTLRDDCYTGEDIANANNVDLFVAIHMNAGGGTGCEVWTYNSASTTANNIGNKICSNISANLGIRNRGLKHNTAYFDLWRTNAQAMIIECLFVDTQTDKNAYNVEKLARAIANGIDSRVALVEVKPQKEHHRNVIVSNAGVDREMADFFALILNQHGEDCISIAPEDLAKYEGGSVFAVGGGLRDKFFYHKIFAGANRYETAQAVLDHLKTKY